MDQKDLDLIWGRIIPLTIRNLNILQNYLTFSYCNIPSHLLCWTTATAISGHMWPMDHRLDTFDYEFSVLSDPRVTLVTVLKVQS